MKRDIFLTEIPVPKDKLSMDSTYGELTMKLFKLLISCLSLIKQAEHTDSLEE